METTPDELIHPLDPAAPLPDLIRIDGRRRHWSWRLALIAIGIVFLLLGVIGWLLPVVTGIPFYVIGLFALGTASERVARRINAWERRLPDRARRLLRPRKRRRAKGKHG